MGRWTVVGVLAAANVALAARARDARACSPPPDGITARTVLPGDGAGDVPVNARVIVEYESDAAPNVEGEVTLRVQGGEPVAVTRSETFARGVTRVLSPIEPLAPSTTYEVLDRLSFDCPEPWQLSCPTDEPRVIATFTTGAAADTAPPSLTVGDVTSSFFCAIDTSCGYSPHQEITSVRIDEVTDDGPVEWIRYEYLDVAGNRIAGPIRLMSAGQACGGGAGPVFRYVVWAPAVFQLRAVDLAGNASPPALIEGRSCAEGQAGTACDPAGADAGDGGGGARGGGCAASRGDGRGLAALAALVALAHVGRRRTRASTSRR